MTLRDATIGKRYRVLSVETGDAELEAFLFSLGCYAGEMITAITHLKSGSTISIKDGRYHIDRRLAEAIAIEE